MKRRYVVGAMACVGACAAAAFAIGFAVGGDGGRAMRDGTIVASTIEADAPVYAHGLASRELFDKAYARAARAPLDVQDDVRSAVVAHHLVAAREIARVFEALSRERPRRIIVVSPNHFSLGRAAAQVSYASWTTPYGRVETDTAAAHLLVEALPFVTHEEAAALYEHGVAALTPFVARSLPRAQMVPIIVDESLTLEEAEELGATIARLVPDAIMVASVDMSHNLPERAAAFHDEVTVRALARGATGAIDLEVDSNASLRVLAAFNRARGAERFVRTHRGSSFAMGLTSDWRENTSHILGVFVDGAADAQPFAAMHIVGDIMLDRGVRRRMEEESVAYPWREMERFLRGAHLRVGNLEGTVSNRSSTYTYDPPFRFVFAPEAVAEMAKYIDAVSVANNHALDTRAEGLAETRERLDALGIEWFGGPRDVSPRYDTTINGVSISLIGYHAFAPNELALLQEIAAAQTLGRFVIVLPHWGAEYETRPSSSQRALARRMVEAGADLIIGGHPHVAQGIEVVDGVLVVYSLGNFVFDQPFEKTWAALTTGVIVESNRVTMHLLPVWTCDGQPTPLDEARARALLERVADVSDASLRDDIIQGVLQYETTAFEK